MSERAPAGLVAINGSLQLSGKGHRLALLAVELAGEGSVIDVATLDAEALLYRRTHPSVDEALAAIAGADRLVITTPVYRATFSGALKVLFDLLPADCLQGCASVLVATGGSPLHSLVVDTGLRPLVASLGGWSVPTAIYATGADFDDEGEPLAAVRERMSSALGEAARVVAGP